ncbi:hypothetical protein, partial [Marinimicrobium sp. UBA4209]
MKAKPRPTRLRPLVLCLLGLSTVAQAQLGLPSAVTDRVDRSIDSVERVHRDTLPADVTSALERRLTAALPEQLPDTLRPPAEPLDALPSRVPILDSRGATLFMDVEVEDGWRAVQHEWLLMLAPGELALLEPLNVEILEQKRLPKLGLEMVR